jgi:hypothetical protein
LVVKLIVTVSPARTQEGSALLDIRLNAVSSGAVVSTPVPVRENVK